MRRGRRTITPVGAQDELTRDALPLHSPVILRSTSHYFSTVTAYLQCLFALPSARAAILSYRPTMEELPGYVSLETDFWSPRTLYEDYWKGEGSGFPTNSIRHASQVQSTPPSLRARRGGGS